MRKHGWLVDRSYKILERDVNLTNMDILLKLDNYPDRVLNTIHQMLTVNGSDELPRDTTIQRALERYSSVSSVWNRCEDGNVSNTSFPNIEDRHCHWKKCFRIVGADMDRQWLDKRKARRVLFYYDPKDREGNVVDIQSWRFDDTIVWDIMEPTDIMPFEKGAVRLDAEGGSWYTEGGDTEEDNEYGQRYKEVEWVPPLMDGLHTDKVTAHN